MDNKNKNIEKEELQKMAPTLFGLKKVNNLKAPEGYFKSLSNSVLEKLESENKKGIPERYFDSLADKVMDKIEQEEAKVIPIRRKVSVRLFAVAASLAVLFLIGSLINSDPTTDQLATHTLQNNEITVENIEEAFSYTETENLICYVDFEEDEIDNDYEFNDIDLDFTSDEIDEYLSSDYYLDVEF